MIRARCLINRLQKRGPLVSSACVMNGGKNNRNEHHQHSDILQRAIPSVAYFTSSTSIGSAAGRGAGESNTHNTTSITVSRNRPTHMIFGANTDVGKTVLSTALIHASMNDAKTCTHYIKPLGCGQTTDSQFVNRYTPNAETDMLHCHNLFSWQTPASPHIASRLEEQPCSDEHAIQALQDKLQHIHNHSGSDEPTRILVELAGGVMSPSSASPLNNSPRHASAINSNNDNTNDTSSWGWSTQGDVYQPLRLPVVLVGDGKLGGISTTLSALESLLVRGYDVHAVVFLEDYTNTTTEGEGSSNYYGNNATALREYANRSFRLRSGSGRALLFDDDGDNTPSIISLPALPPEPEPLDEWFASDEVVSKVAALNQHLTSKWEQQIDSYYELEKTGVKVLWWPFTQHQHIPSKSKPIHIDAASGDHFNIIHTSEDTSDDNSNSESTDTALHRTAHFDACASWWTQGLGHGESSLALASAAASGRYGHVIFPNIIHEPATALADRLVNSKAVGPGYGWASRVFYSDDGSTAMEVAIKMGMKKFCHDRDMDPEDENSNYPTLTVCAQKDCYHGDTLGVMDVAEPSVFNMGQHPWYEPKGLFLAYPTVSFQNGRLGLSMPEEESYDDIKSEYSFDCLEDAINVEKRVESDELYNRYKAIIEKEWDAYEEKDKSRRIGTLVIEPMLLGAGGMKFVDPLWQRALIDFSRHSKNVPVAFDEIATGLFRLGVASCREILKVDPDIASYAKLLTGGLIPMSVTLASEDVFNTFLGDSKAEALLHGHSYTAHPAGCVSSLHALDTFENLFGEGDRPIQSYFNKHDVAELSNLPQVQESMSLGTVLAVTIRDDGGGGGYTAVSVSAPVVKHLYEKSGVYARPLGNVVYIMVSPLTSSEECSRLCSSLRQAIIETSSS